MGIKSDHRPPYVNKLARSVFMQVKGSELAIFIFSILYWTCTSNFRTKFEHCPPPPFWSIFDVHARGHAILLKIEVIFFLIFFPEICAR